MLLKHLAGGTYSVLFLKYDQRGAGHEGMHPPAVSLNLATHSFLLVVRVKLLSVSGTRGCLWWSALWACPCYISARMYSWVVWQVSFPGQTKLGEIDLGIWPNVCYLPPAHTVYVQSFIQEFFLGGGNVNACKGRICVSVHLLGFCRS